MLTGMGSTDPFKDLWDTRVKGGDPGGLVDLWDSREHFDPDRFADLPRAARLYLEHAIAPGTVLASTVKLRMRGEIKLKRWRRFTAEQIIHANHDFVWRAKTSVAGASIRGFDRLIAGKASMRWKVFGLLTVIAQSGPKISRSAAGRAIAESVWLPSSLCNRHVQWTALTERRPRAHFSVHGEWSELALKITDTGEVKELSLQRWTDFAHTSSRYVPFGGIVEEEDRFGGYTIPTRLRIGYYPGTDRFESDGEFIRIAVVSATFI
jgi:hypothetical protein